MFKFGYCQGQYERKWIVDLIKRLVILKLFGFFLKLSHISFPQVLPETSLLHLDSARVWSSWQAPLTREKYPYDSHHKGHTHSSLLIIIPPHSTFWWFPPPISVLFGNGYHDQSWSKTQGIQETVGIINVEALIRHLCKHSCGLWRRVPLGHRWTEVFVVFSWSHTWNETSWG